MMILAISRIQAISAHALAISLPNRKGLHSNWSSSWETLGTWLRMYLVWKLCTEDSLLNLWLSHILWEPWSSTRQALSTLGRTRRSTSTCSRRTQETKAVPLSSLLMTPFISTGRWSWDRNLDLASTHNLNGRMPRSIPTWWTKELRNQIDRNWGNLIRPWFITL